MVNADVASLAPDAPEGKDGGNRHSMLHALALAARSHGVHLSVPQLIRGYGIGTGDTTDGLLVKICRDQGLTAKAVKMTWSQLMRLGRAMPALLRLQDGSGLVIVAVNRDHQPPVALVRDAMDPEGGVTPVDEVSLRSRWDGNALLIKRRYAVDDESQPFSFLWVFSQLLKDKSIFRDVGIASFILSMFALFPPLILLAIVDRILVNQSLPSLWTMFSFVLFFVIFNTIFGYLRRYLVAFGTSRVDARITTHIFDRLVRLPIDVFERTPTGLITFKMSEVWRIRQFFVQTLFGTVLDSMTLIVLLPVMFLLNATLTWFVIGLGVIMGLIVWVYIPAVQRAYRRYVEAETAKNSFLVETIQGMRTVKSLALEGHKRNDWDALAAESVRAHRDLQLVANRPQTLLEPLQLIIYSGTLVLGAFLAITADEAYGTGALLAFVMIAGRAAQPFSQIAQLLQSWEEVKGAMSQVASLVNLEPEATRSDRGLRPDFRGGIVFDGVRFKYPGAQSYALNDASFDIEPGMMVGFMGRSGSGKTTVTRLLQGLNQDYGGLIKIDGSDLRELDLTYLRANLGVVLQDSFLFNGTIRENISAARTDASFEDIMRAARLAGAEEFIERLPRGYETMIEEGATNLSGGQRQRIAIARALICDPRILILDEATSALDPDSEAIVNNNLVRIARGRTMVVVSHRLASLVACDRIFVMERGKVVDCGRHDELLERCDIYRHLWHQQNRHTANGGHHDRPLLASNS